MQSIDFNHLSPEVWKSLGVTLQKVYTQLSVPKLLVISRNPTVTVVQGPPEFSHCGYPHKLNNQPQDTGEVPQVAGKSRKQVHTLTGHLLGGDRKGKLNEKPVVPGHWQLTTKGF